jgi:hypothetical protein
MQAGDIERIRHQATVEFEHELFRAAVDKYKEKLRKRSWFDRIFPWRIVFIRKDTNV